MDFRAYTYFLPWVIFVIIDRASGLGVLWASSTSLVCGVGILGLVAYIGKSTSFAGSVASSPSDPP